MIVPGNGATGGEKVGGGSVRVRWHASVLPRCYAALLLCMLPGCPVAELPCCHAARLRPMLACCPAPKLLC